MRLLRCGAQDKVNSSIYVIGHKNPDTDSICSAIAYASLKRELTGGDYVAARAGRLNEETKYVLEKFGVCAPDFLPNVSLQVRDMDINRATGISGETSIKDAWRMMREHNMRTMPIVRDGQLEGLITTGDIAKSYMDVHDSRILAKAQTPYANIIKTLDGVLVCGDAKTRFTQGKVTIAASGIDVMENFIEAGDLVILGNRYEAQLCAIDLSASCLVVCKDSKVPSAVKKIAEEKDIVIISTPHDAFTVARLINQSVPVRFFMSCENLTTFEEDELVDDIRETMAKKRYRDFPVLDETGRFVGLISRRRLLSAHKKKVILVDHNERSQAVDGVGDAEILEIIDHHRIGSMETMDPVFFRNQPLGATATIIAQIYEENGCQMDKTTAQLLCAAIISDTLMFRSPTCTPLDKSTCEKLAQRAGIEIETLAREMFEAGSKLGEKTAREICALDFKIFSAGDDKFGASQINSLDPGELAQIKAKVAPVLEDLRREKELPLMLFMLTDVAGERTELLYTGERSCEVVAGAFGLAAEELPGMEARAEERAVMLPDVISRKKQLVPVIAAAMMTLRRDD